MKAIIYEQYGPADVLKMVEIEKPVAKDFEVLVRVRASTITPFDWHMLLGTPFLARIIAGLFSPKNQVLGTDAAGIVEEVGSAVSRFKPGDEVFGGRSSGGYAEFATVPEAELYLKPAELSFDEAATLPFSGFTALISLVELGQVQPGQQVLLNGASGGVGVFAIPMAKAFGAEVTAVASSGNLELMRSLGADRVVDYTQEDFAQNGKRYDLIVDVSGKRSFSDCKSALAPQGIYVTTEFSPGLALQGQWVSRTGSQKMIPIPPTGPAEATRAMFEELLTGGKLKPIVDRTFPLSEVAEAFRCYEKGHIQGRIVVTI